MHLRNNLISLFFIYKINKIKILIFIFLLPFFLLAAFQSCDDEVRRIEADTKNKRAAEAELQAREKLKFAEKERELAEKEKILAESAKEENRYTHEC